MTHDKPTLRKLSTITDAAKIFLKQLGATANNAPTTALSVSAWLSVCIMLSSHSRACAVSALPWFAEVVLSALAWSFLHVAPVLF